MFLTPHSLLSRQQCSSPMTCTPPVNQGNCGWNEICQYHMKPKQMGCHPMPASPTCEHRPNVRSLNDSHLRRTFAITRPGKMTQGILWRHRTKSRSQLALWKESEISLRHYWNWHQKQRCERIQWITCVIPGSSPQCLWCFKMLRLNTL